MPRATRARRYAAGVLAAFLLFALSGCFLYPTAANALADFREFALELDGVESVETLSDTPENMAFPFGGTALGTAAVHLDADWRSTLPTVTEAIQEWLATEQTREKVRLSVGVVFPFGAVGVAASHDVTASRVELVTALAEDERVTGASVGMLSESIFVGGSDAPVAVARDQGVTVAELMAEWGDEFSELAPDGTLSIVGSDPTEAFVGGAVVDARDFEAPTSITADSPIVVWADAVDALETVTGWWVRDTGEAQIALDAASSIDAVEPVVRALPGFDAVGSLTFVTPELSIVSSSEAHSPARTLSIELATAGIGGILVEGSTITFDELSPTSARAVLATAATLPGSDAVIVDATVALEGDSSGCGCVAVGEAPIGYLTEVLPLVLDLDASSLEMLWIRDTTTIDASYDAESWDAVEGFLAAIHDEAIDRRTEVGIRFSTSDSFLGYFDAQPTIDAKDVWAGNNDAPQDERHDTLIDIWNGLD